MQKRVSRFRVLVGAIAGSVTLGAMVVLSGVAGGLTPPDPTQVVTTVDICHANNSDTNPYIVQHPSADGRVSGHDDHDGPIWNPTLKDDHIEWGDIIPPFKYDGGTYPGKNWTTQGQAIYANDCNIPDPGSLTVVKAVTNPTGTPATALPTGFTIHVTCDDYKSTTAELTFGAAGGTADPIAGIQAGSTCTVTESGTDAFPQGAVVSYTHSADTGVLVGGGESVTVTVTNDFSQVAVKAAAVTAAPSFTG